MNIELLTKIAEWLEQGGDEQAFGFGFNMRDYFHNDDPDAETDTEPFCNSTCCIAGAAVALSRSLKVSGAYQTLGAQALGLDELTSMRLFHAPGSGQELRDISPQRAARVVRHLIATGNVDWSIQ
jgi:hypothetical protein